MPDKQPNGDGNGSVIEYLRQLSAQRFWGTISLKLENGLVVHVRKEENLKPDHLPLSSGNPRQTNGRT